MNDFLPSNVLLALACAVAAVLGPLLVGRRIPGAIIGAVLWTAAIWVFLAMSDDPASRKLVWRIAPPFAPIGGFMGFIVGLLGEKLRGKKPGSPAKPGARNDPRD